MSHVFHSVIGLPGSGKTTYLAALWHLIDAGEVASELTLERLDGDNSYLNAIADAWRRCEEVPRTSLAAETRVSMHVRCPPIGLRAVISFPDLSGESFEEQVAKRICRPEYIDGCNSDGGILLFVTANRAIEGLSLTDISPFVEGDSARDAEEPKPWLPKMMPDQVRILDLLQFLQRPPFEVRPRKLAVIVSAWDVLPTPQPTPTEWLEREMPLLHQFLVTNKESFELRVYGVSAQGGDVTGAARDELLRQTPSERIRFIGPDGTSHDLTTPILWLMSRTQ